MIKKISIILLILVMCTYGKSQMYLNDTNHYPMFAIDTVPKLDTVKCDVIYMTSDTTIRRINGFAIQKSTLASSNDFAYTIISGWMFHTELKYFNEQYEPLAEDRVLKVIIKGLLPDYNQRLPRAL